MMIEMRNSEKAVRDLHEETYNLLSDQLLQKIQNRKNDYETFSVKTRTGILWVGYNKRAETYYVQYAKYSFFDRLVKSFALSIKELAEKTIYAMNQFI